MTTLAVHLFGRFALRYQELALEGLDARKAQELLCYLLLHRDRPHARESLVGLLWGDYSSALSKKYLRQTLWQLQTVLDASTDADGQQLLMSEPDWLQINPHVHFWLDVAVFEQNYNRLIGIPAQMLDAPSAERLNETVQLYQGDLLEGWYQDWCLYERERLQNMYLSLLDKLVDYYEVQQAYETGLAYAQRLLQYDGARERTHRRLMRLYCLRGDRTAALRQYERCAFALDKELGVRPSARTLALYEQIRADWLKSPDVLPANIAPSPETSSPVMDVLAHLKEFQTTLTDIQRRVQQEINALEHFLMSR